MNEKDLKGYRKDEEIAIYRQEEADLLKQFKAKEVLENLNNEFWHKYGTVNEISRTSNYKNTAYHYSGYQLYFGYSDKSPNIIIGAATEITNDCKKSDFLFTKHGLSQSDCLDINFWEKNSPKSIDERIDINNNGQEEKVLKNLGQRLKDKYSDFMKSEIKNVR